MNKTWLVIEKVSGILIAAWGALSLYSVVHTIWQMINTGYVAAGNTTYGNIIAFNHLNIIVSLIGLYGGILLVLNDKNGWILSVIATAMFTISLFVSSRINSANSTLAWSANFKSYGLLALLFLVIFIVLLLKPFRQKYQPTAKQWMRVTIIMSVLVLDKIIF